jgi:hypothetical protein
MDHEQDTLQVVVSEGILQGDEYGVYVISGDNPAIEYYLIGGLKSLDEARARAQELAATDALKGAPLDFTSIQFRHRPKVELGNILQLMKEEDLTESLREYLDRAVEQLTKSKSIKSLLNYENCTALLTFLAIWLFWTNGSLGVPKGLDLPLVGNHLEGVVLKAETLARYFPIVLLALYTAKFFQLLRTNLEYDLVRQKILILIFHHEWRFKQFINLLAHQRKSMEKSGLGWLVNVSDWFHEIDPVRLKNLRKKSEELRRDTIAGTSPPQEPIGDAELKSGTLRAELDQRLSEWVPREFERRVHNLYFLDKEEDYSRFCICFDPLLYLCSLNRVLFRTYEFLRERGAPVDQESPRDPYLIQRLSVSIFWVGVVLQIFFLGGLMVWSLFVANIFPNFLFFTNLLAIVLVLLIPLWWNYLVIIRHRGYPKFEPVGAYTVGSFTPNRLSMF